MLGQEASTARPISAGRLLCTLPTSVDTRLARRAIARPTERFYDPGSIVRQQSLRPTRATNARVDKVSEC